jgi:glycosyltransferase involved in cell wall biosynthesis
VRIRFLTATPLDVTGGSGTYVGMSVLARALERLGHSVVFECPRRRFPIYTVGRLWFNRGLRSSNDFDLTVGFDMDGYRIAQGSAHVAALKGVIADEVRFESGLTRWTMSIQARCERLHVQRAARVLVTSEYSADRSAEFYGLHTRPAIVPELIDLAEWRGVLGKHPAAVEPFTVLYVGRFYPRKRVDVLLRAAAILRKRLPELRVRIVGNGPCNDAWRALARELRLEGTVTWLGDVTRSQLAAEYNRASAFCLPSVQEGFGIVLIEAMAAGKPIVASRAAAIPEVAPHASFAEPDDAESLAAAIERIAESPEAVAKMRERGLEIVEQYDAALVARRFLAAAISP